MRKWVHKLSVFQRILCVLTIVMLSSNAISLLMSMSKLNDIVQKQIVDATLSTLKVSQLGVSTLIQQCISTVLGLTSDTELIDLVDNSGLNASDRIARHKRMTSLTYRYANINMDPQPKVVAYAQDGDLFTNWDPRSAQMVYQLRMFGKTYLQKVEDGSLPYNTMVWEFGQSPFFETLPQSAHVLRFTLPVLSGPEVIGLVSLMLPEDRLREIIGFSNVDAHTTYLVDVSGLILASSDRGTVGTMLPFPFDLPPVKNGFYEQTIDNQPTIVCYQDAGKYNWYIIDIIQQTYVREAANTAARTLVQGSAVSFIILLVLTLALARSITLPLKRLTHIMTRQATETADPSMQALGKNEVALLEQSYYNMRESLDQLVEKNREIDRQKRNTEIKALQSQIRPHFLFNTLNAIRCSALNNHPEKASDMVMALTQLLRMTLVKGDELIPLSEEVEALACYVRILQERHAKQFEVEYAVDEALHDYRVPNLLLQPLVENSIAHGFANMRAGGVVKVSACLSQGEVLLTVADNGQGFDPETARPMADQHDRFSGIGLDNVTRRIKLYYGEDRGLAFERTDGGWTVVSMCLPATEQGGVS